LKDDLYLLPDFRRLLDGAKSQAVASKALPTTINVATRGQRIPTLRIQNTLIKEPKHVR
jgi:hypothetical protein